MLVTQHENRISYGIFMCLPIVAPSSSQSVAHRRASQMHSTPTINHNDINLPDLGVEGTSFTYFFLTLFYCLHHFCHSYTRYIACVSSTVIQSVLSPKTNPQPGTSKDTGLASNAPSISQELKDYYANVGEDDEHMDDDDDDSDLPDALHKGEHWKLGMQTGLDIIY